jgi:plasmid maintenance system antidote protein VapI
LKYALTFLFIVIQYVSELTKQEKIMEARKVAQILGVTEQQVKSGLLRNAAQLATMQEKAVRTGKNVNGFTAEKLAALQQKAIKNAK